MKRNKMYRTSIVAAIGILLGLATSAFAQAAGNPNPGVLPPGSIPYGASYGQWSARWWQWATSIPTPINPVGDTTGAFAGIGQSGSVWFLAGTFGGAVTRTATVPAGKALFFPILNTFYANEPGEPTTPEQARAFIKPFIDAATLLACEVDGRPVQGLGSPLTTPYRAFSPVFSITLPVDNVFGAPPGLYAPAVADGVYLMLAPLPAGQHTIRIRGASSGFGVDVTYYLTVAQ